VVGIVTEKLNGYKSLDTNKILAEFIQAGGKTLCSEIHKLTFSIWIKEELLQQWKESTIVPVNIKCDNTDGIVKECHCYQLRTKCYPTSCKSTCR
jgi:hypothetical protein